MPGRGARRSRLGSLLALAAVAGFFVYFVVPLYEAVLAAPAAHPTARARAVPAGRFFQTDHDLAARGSPPRLAVLAGVTEPSRLPLLVPSEPGRLDNPDGLGWRPRVDHRPDLSRSPPGR